MAREVLKGGMAYSFKTGRVPATILSERGHSAYDQTLMVVVRFDLKNQSASNGDQEDEQTKFPEADGVDFWNFDNVSSVRSGCSCAVGATANELVWKSRVQYGQRVSSRVCECHSDVFEGTNQSAGVGDEALFQQHRRQLTSIGFSSVHESAGEARPG